MNRKTSSELKAHDCLVAPCTKGRLTARELLKFAGMVNPMSMVIGAKAYIQTKPLFHEVCQSTHVKHGWDVKRKISSEAVNCLDNWVKELEMLPFKTPTDKE